MEFDSPTKEGAGRHSTAPLSPRIERFRQTIHQHLSRFVFLTAVLGHSISALTSKTYDLLTDLTMVAPVLCALGLAAFATKIHWRLRASVLIVTLVLACAMHLHHFAFLLPYGYVGLIFASLLATLLLGTKAGAAVLCICTAVVGIYAYQYSAGQLRIDSSPTLDPTFAGNWVRVMIAFAALACACIASVGFLVNRLQREVHAGDRLVRAVADQSEQRIAALEKQNVLAQQLRQSQKMDAIGLLAGGVAHDFNNLLTVIFNNAELGKLAAVDNEQAFDDIMAASERAAMLTRQLLAFSRRQISEREALDLNATLRQSLNLSRPLLPPQVNVHTFLQEQVGHAWLTRIDLDQIVMNLCVNAAEAMPDGGEITIVSGSTRAAGPDGDDTDWVYIEVVDTGDGIADHEHERIFEPFFSTKQGAHNNGLGLSVVHGLVTQAGGTIDVHSSEGSGCRFRISFPRCPAPQDETVVLRDHLARSMGHETLLVVEDDHATRGMLRAQLSVAGYRVLEAVDGLEALQRFDQYAGEVALVITDIMMPNMSGRTLCSALQERQPQLPILLCSGYSGHKVSEQFLSHPLHGFLAKPFGGQQLLTKVRRLLDRTKQQTTQRPPQSGAAPSWTTHALRRSKAV